MIIDYIRLAQKRLLAELVISLFRVTVLYKFFHRQQDSPVFSFRVSIGTIY